MKKNLLLLILMTPLWLFAQEIVIKGKVTDDKGIGIPGVTIAVEERKEKTLTSVEGDYSIKVPSTRAVLVFTSIGYVTRKVPALNRGALAKVVLASDTKGLNEVVVVGFGTQKKVTVTGAVSSLKGAELEKSPVANLGQALVGRTPGLLTRQPSGQPGNDNVTIRIRGTSTFADGNPLVLVDGVERPFSEIDPSEVDNITVLKDASTTAVYGIRGANGVVLVTTKKGTRGPAKISFTSQYAIQTPTRLPDFAGSYDWATLYNEALKNDNPQRTDASLPFQPDDFQKYQDGSDPMMHPDVDWFDYMMKKTAPQTRQNLNINGGSESARYFVSLSYLEQGGLWKEFNQRYNYSNNDNYKRFNFRANTDFNVTPTTLLSFSVNGISALRHRAANPFYNMMTSAPILTPGIVDGKIVQITKLTTGNPIKAISNGYDDIKDTQINLTFDINQRLDVVTKGLLFRSKIGYNSEYSTTNGRNITPAVYNLIYVPVNGVNTLVFQPISDESIGGENTISYSGRAKRVYLEAALQYNRAFGKNNVGGLLLYNQSKQYWPATTYSLVPTAYQGAVARLTYDYDTRYLVEFNLGYNGSENFPPASRFGWFPAVSGGWNISREPWMKAWLGEKSALSRLKFRASYGQTGNDKFGTIRFLYYPAEYTSGGTAYLGEDQKSYISYTEGKLGNPNITWERSIKQNYGFESAFFGERLTLNFDYFVDKRSDILTARSTIPGVVAASASDGYNIGRMQNKGFELELGWTGKIGKVGYFVNGNYSFARNKVLFRDEIIDVNNPNLTRTGKAFGQPFGLVALGLFNTQAEADAWPVQFAGASGPGDVKYQDVNGDGMINEKDVTAIGYPEFPEVNYGANMGLNYKGFDFSMLWQGATNVSRFLTGFMQRPAVQYGQTLQAVKNERWTPDNTANAIRPKLTVTYANVNNYSQSTLWMRDASYIRLKNVELGYRFSANVLKKLGLNSVRLSVSGQNLLTFDKLKYVDPENATSDSFLYPQLKIYNVGLSAQF